MISGKWLLVVTVATGVMFTPNSEVTASQVISTQGIAASETKKLADLDAKIIEAAKKRLLELAGEHVELHNVVSIYDNQIFINGKEREKNASVVVDQKTGKVIYVSIQLDKDKADPKKVELAIKSLMEIDRNQTFEIETVTKMLSVDNKSGDSLATAIQGKNFNVMFHDDKIDFFYVEYPKSEWNADVKKKAESEFKAATGRTMEIASMARYKEEGKDIWSVLGKDGQSSIDIGFVTGRTWNIYDGAAVGKTDKTALTEKNAVSHAAAFAKKVFNIDLKGYTAKKMPDFPIYEMTKKGAPTVEVMFNSKKGVASMSIKLVTGVRN
ncbi:hypothetical protein [Paenibacillus agilis]|uniref:Uncharacterized protein n=1 Tax=Paenibacillus agilis TaxID=3020863 RepID=A0A559J2E1_9BACL|nr:hypothetical protein [Paenibacillus agilis]TVX94031.1 hypothetical protein FPZ44_13785 [Paenibacillus agilis]